MDTYFVTEAPAHDEWVFGPAEASRIRCPVLFMNGSESSQLYREARDEVKRWLPQTETAVLRGASHLLQIQQPAGAAELLADFFANHATDKSVGRSGTAGRPRRSAGVGPRQYNATTDILEANLDRGRADLVAIRTPDRDWTYADVVTGANRAGNALRGLGVETENRVLLALEDSPEFATSFFGAIKLGAVPVPVNPALRPEELAELLNDSRAKVAVVSDPVARTLRGLPRKAHHLRHVVVVGEPADDELGFAEITRAADRSLETADTTRDDVCFWLYTSGTGGRPKAVMHLHNAMRACVDTYARNVLALDESDTTYSISKLYFAYGLGAGLYFPFAAGATTLLISEPPQPRTVLHVVGRLRPSILFGVPTSYASILTGSRQSSMTDTFESVRMCVSAGESLAGSLLARWKERTGHDIVEGIGSTESCHIFISNRADDIHQGSTGTVVDGYQARIVDESGQDVPDGQTGMLLIKGESVFAGYWRDRELSRRRLIGDWLDTGDVFRRDEAGRFFFQGRLDDMVKVAGMWVSPIEVESALMEHEAVTECAVVGVHDAINLVRLVAFVVPKDGADSDQLTSVLMQHVRQRLGGNKTPRAFGFLDALPKTDTGKVQRAELREQAVGMVVNN